ncbi:MAG: acyl-CoA/acyl-ACP dehydrogenase [Chloroflexi bacterium]|nr:acyl-CoA/acyl-ACP dehydrogenase [Chloroflexota bacterium]
MDLGLSEEQEMLRNFARDFLEKECPESLVREMEEDERGYTATLWQGMARQGWQGLIIPAEYGGAGMPFLDLCVLLEEFGRALVPGPFLSTAVLGAVPVMDAGSDAQKREILPRVASGELVMTLALTEPSGRFAADAVTMRASKEDDAYVLNGTKLFVPDAHVADTLVVAARTGGEGERGISLFLVDGAAPGLSATVLKTIAADKQCEVRFEDVRVPAAALLGAEGAGWEALLGVRRKATVAYCAYLVGLAQRDFEISVDYAKEREQFGRPIGSFQAIQHKAADMVTDVDASRFIMYRAAWAVSEDEPDQDLQVSMAKAWCSDASQRVVAHGQQIHGGIGFTKEYKIQLFFRRQKMAELMWGDGDYHREQVAQLLEIA